MGPYIAQPSSSMFSCNWPTTNTAAGLSSSNRVSCRGTSFFLYRTCVEYGDIVQKSSISMLFTCLLQSIAAGLSSFFIGSVSISRLSSFFVGFRSDVQFCFPFSCWDAFNKDLTSLWQLRFHFLLPVVQPNRALFSSS